MNISRWIVRFGVAAIAHSIFSSLAIAQPAMPPNPEMTQTCPGLVAGDGGGGVIPAAWRVTAPKPGASNSSAFELAALNPDQVRLRVDVIMAPVDGSYTLDLDGMMEVLTALKAPLIIPMHYYGQYILDRFLDRAQALGRRNGGSSFGRRLEGDAADPIQSPGATGAVLIGLERICFRLQQ